MLRYLTML